MFPGRWISFFMIGKILLESSQARVLRCFQSKLHTHVEKSRPTWIQPNSPTPSGNAKVTKRYHAVHTFLNPIPIFKTVHTLFGRQYEHWQSIFFCVAARSIGTSSLVPTFKRIVEEGSLQVHERVDTLVALDATDNQNMLLNGVVDPKDGVPRDASINFLPYPGSSICTYRAKEPWSLFVMLLLNYMAQVPTEHVNMLPYGGSEPY